MRDMSSSPRFPISYRKAHTVARPVQAAEHGFEIERFASLPCVSASFYMNRREMETSFNIHRENGTGCSSLAVSIATEPAAPAEQLQPPDRSCYSGEPPGDPPTCHLRAGEGPAMTVITASPTRRAFLQYSAAASACMATLSARHLAAQPGSDYFPPPESHGGWRQLESPEEIRNVGGADPQKLAQLRDWLLASDSRNFAATVIRRGYIVLEVERGNRAATDSRRVASVSKAVCATVLAIASQMSQAGLTPRRMRFDDPAFSFLPWAMPLSDPRKEKITVQQLFNHTSGICPEALGAPNDGTWEYVLGHSGDTRTAKLAFEPGSACGYSTHAFCHAALVCETVSGKPYDAFAIENLFRPLGIERWWFQYLEGGQEIGRHPSHGLGMPARDLARIAYCMLRGGKWGEKQVVPEWFVRATASATHAVDQPEMRFQLNAQTFSHGWELPALRRDSADPPGDIPADARFKPGSGGQLIAFVPSLDLVVTRQTGGSGPWEYVEYFRRACKAVERSD